jgi:tetratricopeptide (TPR) repeat protein
VDRQVHALIDASRFQEALPLARQALEIWQNSAGRPNIEFAIAAEQLATVLENLQRFSEAEQYYDSAISTHEKVQAEKSAGAASALNGRARLNIISIDTRTRSLFTSNPSKSRRPG